MHTTLIGTDLSIEQNKIQAFNLDTILLANFVKIPAGTKKVLEIGTGAGALLLYMSKKTKAEIVGVEIQEQRYKQAIINISKNNLESQISCLHKDIRTMEMDLFDCIVSNPPFFKVNDKTKKNNNVEDTISRHEVSLSLEELTVAVKKNLKYGGHFFMIHRPDRFAEIVKLFTESRLAIKRVQFVHPYLDAKANHVLIEAIKNGKPGTVIEKPMIVYDEKHVLTKTMKDIYGGRVYVT